MSIKVGRGRNAQVHTVALHFIRIVTDEFGKVVDPGESYFDQVYQPGTYQDLDSALNHAAHVLSFDDDADLIIAAYDLVGYEVLEDYYFNLPTVAPQHLIATITR